jgi:hypothetical protein
MARKPDNVVHHVIRRGKVTPWSGVSASKIDPLISSLVGCLLWREAGGGDVGCGDDRSHTA